MHIFLLIMEGRYKIMCPEQYDLLIWVELPIKKYLDLYKMVTKHMMYGPCGVLNRNCPCTKGHESCKNCYPRPFYDATLQRKDSYPVYRRCDDGRKEKVHRHDLDNRWVMPYNPYLLLCSIATSVLRHVGASRPSSICLSTFTRVMTTHLWLWERLTRRTMKETSMRSNSTGMLGG